MTRLMPHRASRIDLCLCVNMVQSKRGMHPTARSALLFGSGIVELYEDQKLAIGPTEAQHGNDGKTNVRLIEVTDQQRFEVMEQQGEKAQMRPIEELFQLLKVHWPIDIMHWVPEGEGLERTPEVWDAGSDALKPLSTLEFSDEEWDTIDCLNALMIYTVAQKLENLGEFSAKNVSLVDFIDTFEGINPLNEDDTGKIRPLVEASIRSDSNALRA